eukprot:m.217870 g.217870  ORF g.217870 m.217870 type:complete len:73 (+) comp16993_c1_seq1:3225-3443(+)
MGYVLRPAGTSRSIPKTLFIPCSFFMSWLPLGMVILALQFLHTLQVGQDMALFSAPIFNTSCICSALNTRAP